ncbi:MAG: tRNA 5-hydroxyuridine modification protein YegQ [Gammaproteobacteria bacterium]|nr:tRNA 5-hydroxyuridine modification protein YegQ [Gammaproteobacteria bacterium]MBU1624440.1 tRNA 5-hydroxyuridine modification protein YegQ [Gammaproteobacteria bacterium]MBU1981168.1 tRNA 5-hydroxyuridine modification protein YegQ [Gammaproteobacteria bacterium]
MNRPELLLPAASLEKMRTAYAYGADAVYAGQPRYSLRVRNNEFMMEQLSQGIEEAHALGKQFYVASNLMPHNAKLKTYMADMEPIIKMQPDALIMADPGLIAMVREKWPEQVVHLSVQANTVNYAAVKFWKSIGLSRVILSRELSLDEIEEIRQECPDMELEVFVHGALCIAYSGRCLLSGYFNHRDANQGTCTNSCRWDYKVENAAEDGTGHIQKIDFDFDKALGESALSDCGSQPRHPLADRVYMISRPDHPEELMPVLEDEHGTYIMNSKDLRAVEHVEKLVKIGIDSLKVEGRTKSIYYVARTAQVYRQAIDDAMKNRPFDLKLLGALDALASRGYTDGFYERHHTHEQQNYMRGHSESFRQQYVGDIVACADGMAEIAVKNKFSVGDKLEIIHPSGNSIVELSEMKSLKGETLSVAPGSGHHVRIPMQGDLSNGMIARFI